jgi:hypothetical protein
MEITFTFLILPGGVVLTHRGSFILSNWEKSANKLYLPLRQMLNLFENRVLRRLLRYRAVKILRG